MKLIVGTKQHMTQVFDENGKVHPATVISTTSGVVTQVKTDTTDGYTALQLGFGEKKEKHTNKAQVGHFKKAGDKLLSQVKEARVSEVGEAKIGDEIKVSEVFAVGDEVTVSGISKAKGFQGVVKRHNFSGGPRSHGQKHNERQPGSIGGGLRTRVPKGMRMGGRMGGTRVTVPGLKVLAVDSEKNLLIVSGAIPGRKGTLIEVRGK